MGIKEWSSSKSQSFTFGRSISSSRRENHNQQQQQQCIILGQMKFDQYDRQGSKWKLIWKKIKKEKQRILSSNNNNSFNNRIHGSVVATYDPEAYSRNFDEGLECKEPEYLTRSFSARFADPSRMVHKNRFLS